MRKWLFWPGGLLLCLAVLALLVERMVNQPPPPEPGVTVENFKRLHEGMSVKEAEAILGRPPDHTPRHSGLQCPAAIWWGEGFGMCLRINDRPVGIGTTPTLYKGHLHFFDGSTPDLDVQEDPGESPLDQLRKWLSLK